MNNEDFALTVAEHRSSIVKQWSFMSGMSQADCAYELTQHAIAKGFVEPRSPVKGDLMKGWCVKNTAPLWACKSALSLCLENGWQPSNPIEWAVFAYVYIRIESAQQLNDILSSLPEKIAGMHGVGDWLMIAIEDREENRKKKKK